MIAYKEVQSKAGEKNPANFMDGWLSVRDEDPQAFEELHDFTREEVYKKTMFITGKQSSEGHHSEHH